MPGISDAKLKLSWAYQHLQRLDREIEAFAASSDACTVVREEDIENQRYILHMQLVDLPETFALIVGDAFYNMRSSLDQLIWALARLKSIPEKTQFPILEVNTLESRNRFRNQTEGLPKEALCELEFLQPYNRGTAYKTHPLWRLNEMCNLDKHRRIPVNGHEVLFYFPSLTAGDYASGLVETVTTNDCHIVSVPLAMKYKLDFYPTVSVTIKFGGDISGISESPHGIAEIYHFIATAVIPRFERFFP